MGARCQVKISIWRNDKGELRLPLRPPGGAGRLEAAGAPRRRLRKRSGWKATLAAGQAPEGRREARASPTPTFLPPDTSLEKNSPGTRYPPRPPGKRTDAGA